MAEQQYQGPPSDLVGIKRVRRDVTDTKGRDQIVFTFGPDKQGRDGAKELAEAILKLTNEGKQINLDFRIGKKEGAGGREFDAAFLLVKEMVPKNAQSAGTTYAKKPSRQEAMKAKADKVRAAVEG